MSETYEQRFKREKTARIWSDWHSTGVWDGLGVCVPEDWLPVSNYAKALIGAMQLLYDTQSIQWEDEQPEPYSEDHHNAYMDMRSKAYDQVKLELPDWDIR